MSGGGPDPDVGGTSPRVTVLLVDDEPLTRRGVRALLGPDIEVIEVATATEALDRVGGVRPDVVIVEADLPDGDGIDLVRAIRRDHGAIGCIVLASRGQPTVAYRAAVAGAAAFVAKDAPDEGLPEAVRRVAAGQRPLDDALAGEPGHDTLGGDEGGEDAGGHGLHQLSPQERRVVAQVVAGRTNKQVAVALGLAETTVRNYLSTVLRKLSVRNRTELAAHVTRAEMRQHAPRPPADAPHAPGGAGTSERTGL